ncbi:MAG: asparagine synthase (glutamine-hydrolyzing) [Clostridiales bacterium]|nr:asparagine synthase (glutamine-hydrolyzing) [Clostridiales bacterium]
MCGITGWVSFKENIKNNFKIIEAMTDTLKKRGPDDAGTFLSPRCLFGHRRLIVVDPSGGRQPMTKVKGKSSYTLVYNGELYNTEELRHELLKKGYCFDSYSDTEVLLTSYIEWGTECVKKFNGIFAFGIWDDTKQMLFLARDPLGVKPLFYSFINGDLIFGSEIKTLLAHPDVEPVIDGEGLMEVFGLGPARSPGSGVFKYIKEIKPGFYLTFERSGIKLNEYWKLESKPYDEKLDFTIEKLRSLIIDAIERQLTADVPVCTFLSGGLDSSAISQIAANTFKKQNKGPLDTYSIDYQFNDIYFKPDEYQPNTDSDYAYKMAKHINSDHHNVIIKTPELISALKDAVIAYDLPGMADIDSSLYLFCREIRKKETVALSGECADEIFGGYPWYRKKEDIYSGTFPWSNAIKERRELLSPEFRNLPLESYVKDKYDETINEVDHIDGESEYERRMKEVFYLNLKWFMITLLNRKDRMSMSNSLEVRVPYADYRIVEYAYNIPASIKLLYGREKGLLRESLKGLLPEEIVLRKKSPYPKTHVPAYTEGVQKWARDILNDKRSPILQVINIEKFKDIIESGGRSFKKPWFGQLMRGPQLIAYLIEVDTWMREYKVKIE